MTHISVLYFSGYGHTQKQAEAVIKGIQGVNKVELSTIAISNEGEIPGDNWQTLASSDGICFGAPTYMGNVPWQFKKVVDASSQVWAEQGWSNKLAAGFTNSATINGDKDSTLNYLRLLAGQHGMLWMSLGLMPSNTKSAKRNDLNYLGGSTGLLAQSPADASADEGPLPGDLLTAEQFGKRFAEATICWAAD